MKSSQIERVINLVRRTGDRCVIMDNSSEDVLVMMDLKDYENLLDGDSDKKKLEDLSEREMMNKVDRDIAYWRSLHPEEEMEPEEIRYNDFVPTPDEKNWNLKEKMPDTLIEEGFSGEDFLADEDGHEKAEEGVRNFEDNLSDDGMLFAEEKALLPDGEDFKAEESLGDLPHEDEDTFLLEPV